MMTLYLFQCSILGFELIILRVCPQNSLEKVYLLALIQLCRSEFIVYFLVVYR